MTNDEAINELKYIQLAVNSRVSEALEMAIKALEKENEPKTIVNHGTLNIDFK